MTDFEWIRESLARIEVTQAGIEDKVDGWNKLCQDNREKCSGTLHGRINGVYKWLVASLVSIVLLFAGIIAKVILG